MRLRASSPIPAAIVMGMTTNGLSFVRSLGRRGISVLMMDSRIGNPTMRTRFGTAQSMPDICLQPDTWLTSLLEVAQHAPSPPVLIPTGDEHALFVSQHRNCLQQHFRFRIPPMGVVEMLCNKRLQYEFLLEREWALPRTANVDNNADVTQVAQKTVGFPCVLKPYFSHRWQRHHTGVKLGIVHNADQLRYVYRQMSKTGEPLLLQEFIPGDECTLHGYLAYYGADGQPLAAFTKQKLRQYPPQCGNGSLQISTYNQEIAKLSEQMLSALNYQGLAAIEYKWDARDRCYKLIEINPRSISGNQLAIDCGVDLPYINYQDVTGGRIPPTRAYQRDVKYVHLGWDVQALLARRRSGELTIMQWLRSLRGVRSLALFSVRDFQPFLFYGLMVLRQWLHSALKKKSFQSDSACG